MIGGGGGGVDFFFRLLLLGGKFFFTGGGARIANFGHSYTLVIHHFITFCMIWGQERG